MFRISVQFCFLLITGKMVIAEDQKHFIHVRIQLTAFKNRSNVFGWPSISTKACKEFFSGTFTPLKNKDTFLIISCIEL